jgi:hypothetical protein
MMYGSFGGNMAFFGLLHVVGALACLVGVVFLLIWCAKHLSGAQLWKWGWILVIAGVLVCGLTFAMLPGMGGHMFNQRVNGGGMMRGGYLQNQDGFPQGMMRQYNVNSSAASSQR